MLANQADDAIAASPPALLAGYCEKIVANVAQRGSAFRLWPWLGCEKRCCDQSHSNRPIAPAPVEGNVSLVLRRALKYEPHKRYDEAQRSDREHSRQPIASGSGVEFRPGLTRFSISR